MLNIVDQVFLAIRVYLLLFKLFFKKPDSTDWRCFAKSSILHLLETLDNGLIILQYK